LYGHFYDVARGVRVRGITRIRGAVVMGARAVSLSVKAYDPVPWSLRW
jgi:hypothetical protein